MPVTKTGQIFLIIIHLVLSFSIFSEENQDAPETALKEASNENKNSPAFSVSLKLLEQYSSADETIWIDVEQNNHLILKHRNNGRKERGNILLFHAQGENPDHSRLIQPLTEQLTKLGWNLFIPGIAVADFPKRILQKDQSQQEKQTGSEPNNLSNSQQSNSQTENSVDNGSMLPAQTKFFFKNSQAYQDYFIALCQAIYDQTEISKQPFIIITNQNTAYWSLPCLNMLNSSTPTIFLQPQLPISVEDNLDDLFSKQTGPIFSFHVNSSTNTAFSEAFKKRIWRSEIQRFNIGILNSTKLAKENTNIAKTITGWVDKQRKK